MLLSIRFKTPVLVTYQPRLAGQIQSSYHFRVALSIYMTTARCRGGKVVVRWWFGGGLVAGKWWIYGGKVVEKWWISGG